MIRLAGVGNIIGRQFWHVTDDTRIVSQFVAPWGRFCTVLRSVALQTLFTIVVLFFGAGGDRMRIVARGTSQSIVAGQITTAFPHLHDLTDSP